LECANYLIKKQKYGVLIKRMRPIDADARHFQRMTTFKVYLTNPTMRAALFGPIAEHH
jgi:hypothetical protein